MLEFKLTVKGGRAMLPDEMREMWFGKRIIWLRTKNDNYNVMFYLWDEEMAKYLSHQFNPEDDDQPYSAHGEFVVGDSGELALPEYDDMGDREIDGYWWGKEKFTVYIDVTPEVSPEEIERVIREMFGDE